MISCFESLKGEKRWHKGIKKEGGGWWVRNNDIKEVGISSELLTILQQDLSQSETGIWTFFVSQIEHLVGIALPGVVREAHFSVTSLLESLRSRTVYMHTNYLDAFWQE